MLKAFCITVTLSTALIPFLAEIVVANPLPQDTNNSVAPNAQMASTLSQSSNSQDLLIPTNFNPDQLVCYMQTVDGKILNLASLCKPQPKQQPVQDNSVEKNSDSQAYICDSTCRPL